MVRTLAVARAKVRSEYGLAVFSATGRALLVKPVSRIYSIEFDSVEPGATRSRMVSRRCGGAMIPGKR
ncbi:hypothetical protein D3C77_707720 [compost metagenome]